jgi:hypothetical protein
MLPAIWNHHSNPGHDLGIIIIILCADRETETLRDKVNTELESGTADVYSLLFFPYL